MAGILVCPLRCKQNRYGFPHKGDILVKEGIVVTLEGDGLLTQKGDESLSQKGDELLSQKGDELLTQDELQSLAMDLKGNEYHTLHIYGEEVSDTLRRTLQNVFPIIRVNEELPQLCVINEIEIVVADTGDHPSLRPLLFHLRDELVQTEYIGETIAVDNCFLSPVRLASIGTGLFRLSFKCQPDYLYVMGDGRLIEPAFTVLFAKHYMSVPQPPQPLLPLQPPSQASLFDESCSLQSWTPNLLDTPDVLGASDAKTANKTRLKKLMLLSLRHVGVDKNHCEFPSIWKHLYCGCLFALRKKLGEVVSQSEMLAVIRTNMNFLNIN